MRTSGNILTYRNMLRKREELVPFVSYVVTLMKGKFVKARITFLLLKVQSGPQVVFLLVAAHLNTF